MDLSLFLGVLGVVLTIVFFVVGYRQTIGARRERARSANKALVDTLFRRLALEDEFALTRSDAIKILGGWAINARVRSSDVHSLQELEELLLARVLESDYISETQRQTIRGRVVAIFQEEKSPVYLGKEYRDRSKVRAEFLLAIGSGLAAIATAILTSLLGLNGADAATSEILESAIFPAVGLIILTSGVLLVYTRVRDISRISSDQPPTSRSVEIDFERMVYLTARQRTKNLRPSADPRFDFVLATAAGDVGVEVKENVNNLSGIALRRLVARIRDAVESGAVSSVMVVSGVRPSSKVLSFEKDGLAFMALSEFLSKLSENVGDSNPKDPKP